MKRIFSTQISVLLLLLLAAMIPARAADTNHPPAKTNIPAHKPTLEERRVRMEAWRADHSGVTNAAVTNKLPEDTKKLSLPERHARVKARFAASQEAGLPFTNSITNKP